MLDVIDKGGIQTGQEVTWMLPGDGFELVEGAPSPGRVEEFAATIGDVRHLGETTLATRRLRAGPGAALSVSVSGADQRRMVAGAPITVRLDLTKVHVMPRHAQSRVRH